MKLDKDTKRILQGGGTVILSALLILAADMVIALAPAWKSHASWVMKFGVLLLLIGTVVVYTTPRPSDE